MNALAFLKGELLKDAYDDGHRFQYLLWNEEDKECDEASVEETNDNSMKQKCPVSSWIDDLSDEEISAIWSELLSVRNLLPKDVPAKEYYVEIERDGIPTTFSLMNLADTADATKDYLRAKTMFMHEYLNKRAFR